MKIFECLNSPAHFETDVVCLRFEQRLNFHPDDHSCVLSEKFSLHTENSPSLKISGQLRRKVSNARGLTVYVKKFALIIITNFSIRIFELKFLNSCNFKKYVNNYSSQ